MRKDELEIRREKLEIYIKRASEKSLPDDIRSDLSKFGAILLCGLIEKSIENILMSSISQKSHPRIENFFKIFFNKGTNYNCDNIESILQKFDKEWSSKFNSFIKNNNEIKEKINSVYGIRNSIAHGENSGITIHQLKNYFEKSNDLIKEVSIIVNKK
jgi:hypothetical protein